MTKSQRRNLKLYARYRNTPPTVGGLLRENLWRYGLSFVALFLLYSLAPAAQLEALPLILGGMLIGVLARDLNRYWTFVRTWPATAAVLDWERVEDLLATSAAAKSPGRRD
ncbi:MAG: hypothetical protein R3300_20755 [Candidatus Promineifilaceae bacterium]|nr:hypothetical protein [Candidatus Promineifilaceae bacterium]